MEPVFRALELTALSAVKIAGARIDYLGLEHIPARGGAVIAINHTGYVDFLPAGLAAYHRDRRMRFMIKAEMQQVPVVNFLIRHTRTIPVDRSAGADAYRNAVAALRSG
ncbi:lysophospholipid acyltransferase family protein, partial [Mycobacterium sp. UM_Kg1]|uniref:lysophospholipid acyltransferase family protein n=1 Tax=Mycobacterium sp. UM_Kg1 TaxID=1545691 RepID=UPI00061ACDAB